MKARLRVLMVEDSETDAKLVVHTLRAAGHEVDFERVDEAGTLISALSRRPWDVVISDWSMPRFRARDALAIVRAALPDVPFIIVSGTAGEENAVAAMRAGAQDYVLKENLTRLAPAVERELRESQVRAAHRQAQEALRQSEARYRALFENSPLPKWLYDLQTLCFLAVNDAAVQQYGYSREAFLEMTIQDIIPPEDTDRLLQEVHRVDRDPHTFGQWRAVRKDGSVIDLEVTSHAFEVDGRMARLVVAQDITERLRAEKALRVSEARFSRLAESGIIGISVADVLGNIHEANQAYLDMLGFSREEMRAGKMRWADLTPPEWGAADERAVELLKERGVAPAWEKELFRKDGTRVPVLLGVAMLDYPDCIAIIEDLTERKRAEEALRRSEAQLQQAQKMDAIGQLTGGVAHDFNNLLSVILSYSTLIAEDLPPGDPKRADLREIENAGQRAAALTHQLLAFSRRQLLQPRVVDFNHIVTGLEKMLRRLIGEDVELRVLPSATPAMVNVDPGQMEQVIMNLAVNARDAMPQGGQLTIEIGSVELDADFCSAHTGATPGAHVMLAVSDTGCGMDAATQARVFEPFFTTKERGKGTGLGLSTVFGIVRQSAGTIWIYSEPGRGTAFKIYLPVAGAGQERPLSPPVDPARLQGSETILVVEDEDGVRNLVHLILARNGYRVLEARDGVEALRIAGEQAGLDLLLTDVVLPQMGGAEIASRLRALRPGLKLLYMSGYTDNAVVLHGVLRSEAAFVQKPITPAALLTKVREVLDAENPQAGPAGAG